MNRALGNRLFVIAMFLTGCAQQPAAPPPPAGGAIAAQTAPEDRAFRIPPDEIPVPVTSVSGHTLLRQAVALIQAPDARAAFSVSGTGLAAAILDTGINAKHVDFGKDRIPVQYNLTPDNGGDTANAADGQGHGTNVAGIVGAREGYPPSIAQGMHTGVAPGANLIPIKVLTNAGTGNFDWVEKALKWVIDNREKYHISVANLSLGNGQNVSTDDGLANDNIRKLVKQLRDLKVAVVVAAGNDYFRNNDKKQGMSYPAIIRETVSAGAVFDADVGPKGPYSTGVRAYNTSPDRITPFSQRLHESLGAFTRTDIFAPGAVITSTGIGGPRTELDQQGTSQAAPMTAGVILLMQEYHVRIRSELPTVDNLEKWLREGAVSIVDDCNACDNVPHTKLTFPRLNALGSLKAMKKAIQP